MQAMFLPQLYVSSIYEIDLQRLWNRGVRGIIVDLDNTLVAWNHPHISKELSQWVASVRQQGLELCIVSNNVKERVHAFASQIAVTSFHGAAKPRKQAFRRAMEHLGLEAPEIAVVGDQIFTDIFGGNRLGCYTILVQPVGRQELLPTRMVRWVEYGLIRRRLAVAPDLTQQRGG